MKRFSVPWSPHINGRSGKSAGGGGGGSGGARGAAGGGGGSLGAGGDNENVPGGFMVIITLVKTNIAIENHHF